MININGNDYKLKITLGFYKRLSFPQAQLNTILEDANRLCEAIKLALFFGNKQDKGWGCIADMEKVISDEDLEMLDDPDLIEKLNNAVYNSLPKSTQEALDEKSNEVKKK